MNKGMIVYPNPADGNIKVDIGKLLSEFTLKITDISGKQIMHGVYRNTKLVELYLEIPAGVYLITVYSDNGCETIRLVKL
jgi:hypothetical protein